MTEFGPPDPVQFNALLLSRFKEKDVPPVSDERVEVLRRFKNQVREEIQKAGKSKYYTHQHSQYADMRDFAAERLVGDYRRAFPELDEKLISAFINFAIYLYYLR